MSHVGHFDVVCKKCEKRTGGCRCPEPGKEQRKEGLCAECQHKANIVKQILKGPSKQEFMTALSSGNSNHRSPVTFHLEIGTVSVSIDGIQREDGSGESWNFYGWLFNNSNKVRGYYSTKTGKGIIQDVEL